LCTQDFVFYADRLIRLVVEKGLGLLPFSREVVITPTEEAYFGVQFVQGIIGVSIIRSGESMESALRGTLFWHTLCAVAAQQALPEAVSSTNSR